jgi:hypothetical protein
MLTHVEFMDCLVGPVGCRALGDALMLGANKSLMTLRLDNNPAIGSEGVVDMCLGLRTNKTLKACLSWHLQGLCWERIQPSAVSEPFVAGGGDAYTSRHVPLLLGSHRSLWAPAVRCWCCCCRCCWPCASAAY